MHKSSKPLEDEYENDFEDYDDDFEASAEESQVAQSKVPIPSAAKAVDIINSNQSKSSIQNFSTISSADAKRSLTNSGTGNSAKSSRGGIGSSLSRSMVDPRSVRIQRIVASNVLDLKLERGTLLNIPPSSKYDLYLNGLRSTDATVKQIGVPTDLDIRDMEVNTDEINFADKEVQFCDGDDTKFFNMLNCIEQKKSCHNKEVKQSAPSILSSGDSLAGFSDRMDLSTGLKLSDFLRKSSAAIEGVLTYSTSAKALSKFVYKEHRILVDSIPWKSIGDDGKNGANEMLRNRVISSIKFSELQNDVFLTIHPYSEIDEDDLRPFKTLIAVWNFENTSSPAFLLEGAGDVKIACFSSAQPHFVLGGSVDGSLLLWDLREASINHQDRDTIDLKIQRGIRKSSFSTHYLSHSTESVEQAHETEFLHSASIIDLISPHREGTKSVSSSQFSSLDQTGKVVFWVTQDTQAEDERNILRVSPWSNVVLIPTKSIACIYDRGTQTLSHISPRSKTVGFSWLDYDSFLLSTPDDSCLLFPERDGRVSKIVRIGEPMAPPVYSRSIVTDHIAASIQTPKSQLDFASQVTCVAVRPTLVNSSLPNLMVIGRCDGSIDLFQLDQQYPVVSWNVGNLLTSRSVSANNLKNQKIILLKWLPFCETSFLALDGNGTLHHFDLMLDIYKPFRSESLGLPMKLSTHSVSLSFPKSHVNSIHISVADPKRPFKAFHRDITLSGLNKSNLPLESENIALFERLSRSTTIASQEKRVLIGQSRWGDAK
jgi:hypothetical protein